MQPRKDPRDSSSDGVGAGRGAASLAAASLTLDFGFHLDDESWLGSTRAAAAHSFLGECLRQLGKLDEAEAVLLEASAGLGSDANSRFRVALSLIDLYDAAGQSEKAARWRACIQAKPHREWAPPGIPAAQPALIAPEGDGEAE